MFDTGTPEARAYCIEQFRELDLPPRETIDQLLPYLDEPYSDIQAAAAKILKRARLKLRSAIQEPDYQRILDHFQNRDSSDAARAELIDLLADLPKPQFRLKTKYAFREFALDSSEPAALRVEVIKSIPQVESFSEPAATFLEKIANDPSLRLAANDPIKEAAQKALERVREFRKKYPDL